MSDELMEGRDLRSRRPRLDHESDLTDEQKIVPARRYVEVDPPSQPYVVLEPPAEAPSEEPPASEQQPARPTLRLDETELPPTGPSIKPATASPSGPPAGPPAQPLMRLPRIKDVEAEPPEPEPEPLSPPVVEPKPDRHTQTTQISEPTDALPRPEPTVPPFIPNFDTSAEETAPVPAELIETPLRDLPARPELPADFIPDFEASTRDLLPVPPMPTETPSGALLPRIRVERDGDSSIEAEVVTGEFLETAEKIPTAAWDLHMAHASVMDQRLPRATRRGGTTFELTSMVYQVVRTQWKKIAVIAAVLLLVMALILVPQPFREEAPPPTAGPPGADLPGLSGGTSGPAIIPPALGTSTQKPSPAPPTLTPTPLPGYMQGQVAFASNRDGDFDIYVRSMATGAELPLTSNTAADRSPAWSPDGKRIVFVSNVGGSDDLYVVNADGTGLAQVTSLDAHEHDPAWSPDGTRIAFSQELISGSRLMLLDAACIAGGAAACDAAITPILEERYDLHPVWRPDGALIAFAASDTPGQPLRIAVITPEGQGFAALAGTGSSDFSPAWSPDGSRIAFVSYAEGDDDLWVMQPDGSGLVQITAHEDIDAHPSWSPDGQHLVFASDRGPAGDFDLYWMRADCAAPDQGCDAGALNVTIDPGDDLDPAWSPRP